MIKAKLIVVGGDAKSKEVNLRLPTVIGRGRDVTLTLPHPLVSRRHTEIFEKDGFLYVKDLGSLNGTYVNNRKISTEQRLAPNELLTLGNVTFRAMYEAADDRSVKLADQPDMVKTERADVPERENDETVQFQRFDEAHDNAGRQEPNARKPLKSVATEQVAAEAAANSSEPALDVDESPEKKPGNASPKPVASPAASDKVETPSDIFSGEEDFLTPEKSISLNALESLPPMNPSVSAVGEGLDLGDQPQRSAIDSIDLDLEGPQRPDDSGENNAALGSFLKKLPR